MEGRGLVRGAVLLLLLSVVRTLTSGGEGAPVLQEAGEDHLPTLLGEAEEVRDRQARRSKPLAPGESLDPNRSSEEELDRLPGVGPRVAAAITRHREEGGGFRRAEDLVEVPGIGPATLARIRPHLDFSRGVPVELRAPEKNPEKIDVNRAGREELQSLPGIGPALAQRILDSRAREGAFRVPEDLLRVKGIGEATLLKLVPLIHVRR
jgi:competence protein ComEA